MVKIIDPWITRSELRYQSKIRDWVLNKTRHDQQVTQCFVLDDQGGPRVNFLSNQSIKWPLGKSMLTYQEFVCTSCLGCALGNIVLYQITKWTLKRALRRNSWLGGIWSRIVLYQLNKWSLLQEFSSKLWPSGTLETILFSYPLSKCNRGRTLYSFRWQCGISPIRSSGTND